MLSLRPPGDKSLTHRILLLAPWATGTSHLRGLLVSRDTEATAGALRALGVPIPPLHADRLSVIGPAGLRPPEGPLECANSGTTARLLLGLLAGSGLPARLDGDASLRRRPMERVVYPLQAMGARLRYAGEEGRLPVEVERRSTGSLRPLRHRLRVASAQVKSALLLAGLAGRVRVEVEEPGRSRDHTERLLAAMGGPVTFGPHGSGARAAWDPGRWDGRLQPLDIRVPGDPSGAAFLVAGAVLAGCRLRIEGICLNPTRTGFLEVLREMGVGIRAAESGQRAGEPVGDLEVEGGQLRPFSIREDRLPRLVDEVPVLSVLAARADGRSVVVGAGELRVKESDRLARLAENLTRLGVVCAERPDGLEIEGTAAPLAGTVETGGDHRIAMAFGALDCQEENRIRVDDPACVAVSYPGFWKDVRQIRQRASLRRAGRGRATGSC
ncbi:MAG: 3-phosphoshikimate 1-carboxyvinyltransferase [Gemmatimonadota bacterium]